MAHSSMRRSKRSATNRLCSRGKRSLETASVVAGRRWVCARDGDRAGPDPAVPDRRRSAGLDRRSHGRHPGRGGRPQPAAGGRQGWRAKLCLGAVLAASALAVGLVLPLVDQPLTHPEITLPVAMAGSLAFPFALFGSLWWRWENRPNLRVDRRAVPCWAAVKGARQSSFAQLVALPLLAFPTGASANKKIHRQKVSFRPGLPSSPCSVLATPLDYRWCGLLQSGMSAKSTRRSAG